MPLGLEIGLSLGDFVFDGVPFFLRVYIPQKKGTPIPNQFLAHVCCGQTAGWMKTLLGTEADLGLGHIILDGVPAIRERGTAAPCFRPMSTVATVAHLSYC